MMKPSENKAKDTVTPHRPATSVQMQTSDTKVVLKGFNTRRPMRSAGRSHGANRAAGKAPPCHTLPFATSIYKLQAVGQRQPLLATCHVTMEKLPPRISKHRSITYANDVRQIWGIGIRALTLPRQTEKCTCNKNGQSRGAGAAKQLQQPPQCQDWPDACGRSWSSSPGLTLRAHGATTLFFFLFVQERAVLAFRYAVQCCKLRRKQTTKSKHNTFHSQQTRASFFLLSRRSPHAATTSADQLDRQWQRFL